MMTLSRTNSSTPKRDTLLYSSGLSAVSTVVTLRRSSAETIRNNSWRMTPMPVKLVKTAPSESSATRRAPIPRIA